VCTAPNGRQRLDRACIGSQLSKLPDKKSSYRRRAEGEYFVQHLEVEIQQAMDVLQVVRKNPSQTTEVDLKEENEAAKIFLTSLKQILKRRMLKNHDEN
jgi:hypothetical protein